MSYLLDTNVISELRKGERCDPKLAEWFGDLVSEDLFLSVLTIGELRKGIDSLARHDSHGASILNRWLQTVVEGFGNRIVSIDRTVAEEWGSMNVPSTLPAVDGLLAATAKVHGLVLVTRNTKHVARTGVSCLNPFSTTTP